MASSSSRLVYSFQDKSILSKNLADLISTLSREAISDHGTFTLALSGGSLPELFARHIIQQAEIAAAATQSTPHTGGPDLPDFEKWHVFLADERCVPLHHPDSNFGLCKTELFDKISHVLPNLSWNVYPIDPDLTDPKEIAKAYQQDLLKVVKTTNTQGVPVLDAIFLGMGPDGHTCSLFPNHPLLDETTLWVTHIEDSPKPPPKRVTLTYPVLNAARSIVFVVTGRGKAEPVRAILEQGSVAYPSGRVHPESKRVFWFLDEEAASLLQKTETLRTYKM